jgi:EF hand
MNRIKLAASMLALALSAGAWSAPAFADSHDLSIDKIFAMADKNKDQLVTRAEFLDAMGKVYDMKMKKMKEMKMDKMMSGNAMTREGIKSIFDDVHHGA